MDFITDRIARRVIATMPDGVQMPTVSVTSSREVEMVWDNVDCDFVVLKVVDGDVSYEAMINMLRHEGDLAFRDGWPRVLDFFIGVVLYNA